MGILSQTHNGLNFVDSQAYIQADGTTVITIKSNGNVGIGTTNPSYPLEVAGAGTVSLAYQRTGVSAKKWGFHSDNNSTYWQNLTDNILALTLSNAGNVGIGTTSPVVKLQVDGTITSTGVLTAYTSVPSINIGHNGDSAFIAATSGGGADTPISFSVGNNNEKMRITSAGNVGIGTTSPTVPLTVVANSGGNAVRLLGRAVDGYAFTTFRNNADSATNGEIGISDAQNMLF